MAGDGIQRALLEELAQQLKEWGRWHLEADEASMESARQTLERLGLEPGGYWVACVGGTAHVSIKTWPPGATSRTTR